MSDDDLDARVAALTDDDIRRLAAGERTETRVEDYRPGLVVRRLAAEVLRLRAVADAAGRYVALASPAVGVPRRRRPGGSVPGPDGRPGGGKG